MRRMVEEAKRTGKEILWHQDQLRPREQCPCKGSRVAEAGEIVVFRWTIPQTYWERRLPPADFLVGDQRRTANEIAHCG